MVKPQSGNKVGLDRPTWLGLIALVLSFLMAGASVLTVVFKTNTAAATEHADIEAQMIQVLQSSLEKHADKPHTGTASAVSQEKLREKMHDMDKKLSIIGDRVGAGRAMRKVDNGN